MPYYQQDTQSRPITYHLIIVNVIFFLATLINENFMIANFGLWHPHSPYFKVWQPLSYMFMHGGFWHILFNMYSLWIFGMAVERFIGARKFLILYFATGLGAAAAQLAVQSFTGLYYPTVGASGCVYGIIVAFAVLFPQTQLTLIFPPVTLSAKMMAIIFHRHRALPRDYRHAGRCGALRSSGRSSHRLAAHLVVVQKAQTQQTRKSLCSL